MKKLKDILVFLFVSAEVHTAPFDSAQDKLRRSAKARLNTFVFLALLLVGIGGQAQQLQSYIQEAEANNPEIKAFELRYNMAEEKVNEAYWVPNTEFSAGYFLSTPETRTGAQKARFSARQMLPWFGTISARANYASVSADAEYEAYVIAKRKLAMSLAQSYYKLYALKAKQEVLNENLNLLHTYESLALTSVEVNKATAVDVLRLQIRQNDLQQQVDILEEGFLAEQANFNGLLNKEIENAISIISDVSIPETDIIHEDSLLLNPELTRFDRLYESVSKAELLNQKENAPMLGFGMDYIPVQARPNMDFSDNGKDIFMPMVSVTIPIFNKMYDSRSTQNGLRQLEIEALKQNRLKMLETTLAKAVYQRHAARISYNTQIKNLMQARNAEDILITNYETGTMDFNDVLDIQELQLKFQMNSIESVEQYYRASATINYLIRQR